MQRSSLLAVLLLLTFLRNAAPATETSPATPLTREAVAVKARSGVELLDKLYWSPALSIWLDRAGDDLRAHYEGRINPPWWSSANAVELLLDLMKATGGSEYEQKIAELYASQKDPRARTARMIEELKRRHQWNESDEARWQRRQQRAAAQKQDQPAGYYSDFQNEYLDDSGWWGITWLKMHERTREEKYLSTARTIHAHMARNWSPEKGGGVLWCEEPDKQIPNAITNSLFLILSARLSKATGDAAYLAWAERTLEWFRTRRLYDGIGVVDAPEHQGDYWTYNQGAFLGALTALFQATGRQEYLDEAVHVVKTVLNRSGLLLPGDVIFEKLGTSGWDPGLFKGVFVRYLGQLRDVLNASKLHAAAAQQIDDCLRSSVASMLQHSVGPDGQYGISWHGGAPEKIWNFNTQTAGLCAFVALLEPAKN